MANTFFLEGLGGGVKLWQQDNWRFDLLGQMRFVDMPRDVQNEIQADTIDFGRRLIFSPFKSFATYLELISDDHSRMHANLRFRYMYQNNGLDRVDLESQTSTTSIQI